MHAHHCDQAGRDTSRFGFVPIITRKNDEVVEQVGHLLVLTLDQINDRHLGDPIIDRYWRFPWPPDCCWRPWPCSPMRGLRCVTSPSSRSSSRSRSRSLSLPTWRVSSFSILVEPLLPPCCWPRLPCC